MLICVISESADTESAVFLTMQIVKQQSLRLCGNINNNFDKGLFLLCGKLTVLFLRENLFKITYLF